MLRKKAIGNRGEEEEEGRSQISEVRRKEGGPVGGEKVRRVGKVAEVTTQLIGMSPSRAMLGCCSTDCQDLPLLSYHLSPRCG